MDIKFECQSCGQHIVMDEGGAGLTIQCPNCNDNCVVRAPEREFSTKAEPGPSADCYYILQGNSREGPYTLEQVAKMLAAGEITLETLYAQPGMAEWVPLSENRCLHDEYPLACPPEPEAQGSSTIADEAGTTGQAVSHKAAPKGTSHVMTIDVPQHAEVWAKVVGEMFAEQGWSIEMTMKPAIQSVASDDLEKASLFGGGCPKVTASRMVQQDVEIGSKVTGIQFSEDWITIEEPSYSGHFCRSQNSRFILVWSEDIIVGEDGEVRECGNYLLLDGSIVKMQGTLRRPNDGKVANNGNFILSDWGENVFYAFSPFGEILIKKQFDSAADSNGLSGDGRWAVTEGYAGYEDFDEPVEEMEDSDTEEASESLVSLMQSQDGGELWLFDLEQRALRAHFGTFLRNPIQFSFDLEREILHVAYRDGLIHRYSFDGDFLDSETWRATDYANGYQLLFAAEARLSGIQGNGIEAYSEVMELLRHALAKGVSEFTQAKIHRHLGEIYNCCNDKPNALEHLKAALRLNPKIGVKKLVARLDADSQAGS